MILLIINVYIFCNASEYGFLQYAFFLPSIVPSRREPVTVLKAAKGDHESEGSLCWMAFKKCM